MTELFKSSHDALVFAFNFSSAQYGISELARLAGPSAGSGKGLVGMDGAGQAGMIKRYVDDLGHPVKGDPLHKAVIVAQYSPKYKDCPCCGGTRMPIAAYHEAIQRLVDSSAFWISGISKRAMREAIIRSRYENGVSIKQEADRLHVAKSTAYDQKSVIIQKLQQIEQTAFRLISLALTEHLAPADGKVENY